MTFQPLASSNILSVKYVIVLASKFGLQPTSADLHRSDRGIYTHGNQFMRHSNLVRG